MRFKKIKKWLIDRDLTQSEIAKELGLSRMAIYKAMKGLTKTGKAVDALKKLGCPYLDEKAA